jgi:hypothetical protein
MEKIDCRFSIKTTTMPTYFQLINALLFTVSSCTDAESDIQTRTTNKITEINAETIRGISLPQGFSYVEDGDSAYSKWLLDLKLKKNKTVYLYNGKLKSNQAAQYAVINLEIGKKDLVQCADAAMKLRADYLFEKHFYDQIKFLTTSGDAVSFKSWLNGIRWKEKGGRLIAYSSSRKENNIQQDYDLFMEFVFSYCGSYSLSKQMTPVDDNSSIQPGDVFVYGGFPGHAVTVMAVAKNDNGNKIFLLSQGYMPAQDIHILKNYANTDLSPWYAITEIFPLYTPQWEFKAESLRRW